MESNEKKKKRKQKEKKSIENKERGTEREGKYRK